MALQNIDSKESSCNHYTLEQVKEISLVLGQSVQLINQKKKISAI
jgi:hypothetical protein